MTKYLSLFTAGVAAVAMTGCLEVKDNNSNAELVTVIEEQNQLLEKQMPRINLVGKVKNISLSGNIANAELKIKVANQPFELVTIDEDGQFSLANLPIYSDFTLVVSSTDNSFPQKVIFDRTKVSDHFKTYSILT